MTRTRGGCCGGKRSQTLADMLKNAVYHLLSHHALVSIVAKRQQQQWQAEAVEPDIVPFLPFLDGFFEAFPGIIQAAFYRTFAAGKCLGNLTNAHFIIIICHQGGLLQLWKLFQQFPQDLCGFFLIQCMFWLDILIKSDHRLQRHILFPDGNLLLLAQNFGCLAEGNAAQPCVNFLVLLKG